MTLKNYYASLGLKRNATGDDVRQAYRRLARRYHPDVSAELDAEVRMREINEAYGVLSDPMRRRAYDRETLVATRSTHFGPGAAWTGSSGFGRTRPRPAQPARSHAEEDFFSSFFSRARRAASGESAAGSARARGGANGANGAKGTAGANGAKGTQGANGTHSGQGANGAQRGNGANGANGTNGTSGGFGASGAAGANGAQGSHGARHGQGSTGAAGGGGTHYANDGARTGGASSGTGTRGTAGARAGAKMGRSQGEDHHAVIEIDLEDAIGGATREIKLRSLAHDAGVRSPAMRTLSIDIPAGVRGGQQIRLAGQGRPGRLGGKHGDLLLEIRIKPHRYYRIEERDLYVTLPITPSEAALGANVLAPTPAGKVEVTIPPGTVAGCKLRLRARGMPGTPAGDLYLVLSIVAPPAVSPELRDAYEALARAHAGFNPRGAF
jgi:DnaJ-class molecular chaperone